MMEPTGVVLVMASPRRASSGSIPGHPYKEKLTRRHRIKCPRESVVVKRLKPKKTKRLEIVSPVVHVTDPQPAVKAQKNPTINQKSNSTINQKRTNNSTEKLNFTRLYFIKYWSF